MLIHSIYIYKAKSKMDLQIQKKNIMFPKRKKYFSNSNGQHYVNSQYIHIQGKSKMDLQIQENKQVNMDRTEIQKFD